MARGTGERGSGKVSGVLFSTDESIEPLRAWCEQCCVGDWSLVLEDLDLTTRKKILRLHFERDEDKAAFIARFGRIVVPASPANRVRSLR